MKKARGAYNPRSWTESATDCYQRLEVLPHPQACVGCPVMTLGLVESCKMHLTVAILLEKKGEPPEKLLMKGARPPKHKKEGVNNEPIR